MVLPHDHPGTPASPSISVILSTRDRPAEVERAVASVLAGTWADFELLVLDQSRDRETEWCVAALSRTDTRLRYQRVEPTGKSSSLNQGMAAARGALLAFLDDDCEAPADWLARIQQAFAADPALMLLVGAVVAGPHAADRGFVPTFCPRRRVHGLRLLAGPDKPMGANMAMRRQLPLLIGGFDPMLGAGAPLRSSYDFAYCYHAIRSGYRACADPSIVMVHHGFRTWREGSHLVEGYALGTAAAYTKFIRLGDTMALVLLVWDLARYVARLASQAAQGKRPLHLRALVYRVVGIAASFRYQVDPTTRTYLPPRPARRAAAAPPQSRSVPRPSATKR